MIKRQINYFSKTGILDLGLISTISHVFLSMPPPHTMCAMPFLEPMFITCRLLLATRICLVMSSGGSGGDKMAAVRGQVEEVKGVMVENIGKLDHAHTARARSAFAPTHTPEPHACTKPPHAPPRVGQCMHHCATIDSDSVANPPLSPLLAASPLPSPPRLLACTVSFSLASLSLVLGTCREGAGAG